MNFHSEVSCWHPFHWFIERTNPQSTQSINNPAFMDYENDLHTNITCPWRRRRNSQTCVPCVFSRLEGWFSAVLCLVAVWWSVCGQRLLGHVHQSVGRRNRCTPPLPALCPGTEAGEGSWRWLLCRSRCLCPHADWTPVADQRDGAAQQHSGVGQRRLHSASVGRPDGTLSPHAAGYVKRHWAEIHNVQSPLRHWCLSKLQCDVPTDSKTSASCLMEIHGSVLNNRKLLKCLLSSAPSSV